MGGVGGKVPERGGRRTRKGKCCNSIQIKNIVFKKYHFYFILGYLIYRVKIE